MKKLLTLALVLVVALSMSATATNMRVLTMGENNNVLLDDANIWLYPSRINNYPNLGIAEVSSFSSGVGSGTSYTLGQFGIHWKFGTESPWVLGTYLYNGDLFSFDDFVAAGTSGESYYWDSQLGLSQQQLPLRLPAPFVYEWFENDVTDYIGFPGASAQRLSLFYGRQLGGWPFGFSFNKFHWSCAQEFENDPADPADNFIPEVGASEYTFGLGLTNPAGTMDLAASLSFLSWKNKASNGEDITKPGGNMTVNLTARYFHQVNPTWTLVPNAGIIFGKYEAEFYNGTTTLEETEKYSLTNFRIGTGVHYTPAANVLAVADVGISYYSNKFEFTDEEDADDAFEVTDKIFTLPYLKMGLEAQVFDWMDMRLGATSYWHRWTMEEDYPDVFEDDGESRYNFPSNQTYFGLGFNWNRLHIDTWTDPEVFLNGLYLLTGKENNSDVSNFGVSLLYDMF